MNILSLTAEQLEQNAEDLVGYLAQECHSRCPKVMIHVEERCMNPNLRKVSTDLLTICMKCMKSFDTERFSLQQKPTFLIFSAPALKDEIKGRSFPSNWALLYLCSGSYCSAD